LIEAEYFSLAFIGRQIDFSRLTRLKTNGGPGGNIKPVPAGRSAIKIERRVGLGAMPLR